ncbi:MAG: succinyldiaminopimelate transaminase [Gammaproteobacteria bacterium]|nr:succinyldiaminopimelate transaminase [Gammaproteobacteria bacterium]
MNPDLSKLHPYPFEKLAALKEGVVPPAGLPAITLSIGEPQHASPAFVREAFASQMGGFAQYPYTKGSLALRVAIIDWLTARFKLASTLLEPESHVIPVAGTREALFAFAQATIDRSRKAYVLMPNPFYQIYEGAALLAGATPWYMNTTTENGFLPDLDAVPEHVWRDCQLIYICNPGNPTGAVMDETYLRRLLTFAERYNFVIASDECYSEIYPDEDRPPLGLLQVAAAMGNTQFKHCVVFHSLSKRSNLPGLRSGFVAGDAQILAQFLKYRTYHGCALPPPTQAASIAAWQDELHVQENRALYRKKFAAVLDILRPHILVHAPDASFYLWLHTPIADTQFTQMLFAQQNVTVLPGSFLSRDVHGSNPGANYVRIALVAPVAECIEAAQRITHFLQHRI